MTKLLHIGFGKAASTTLQEEIFPFIGSKLNIPLFKIDDFFKINKEKTGQQHILESTNITKLPNKFIISDESLVGENWQFHEFEKGFNLIKERFESDTQILIIIRKPNELFNSIYIQSIQDLKLLKEKDFFININPKEIKNKENNNNYNLHGFSYEKLINMYKSYFDKVHIVKYENLDEFNFLYKIFPLNIKDHGMLKNQIGKKKWNKSFSKFGVNLCFFLNKFFNLKNFDLYVQSKIIEENPSLITKIKNKFLRQLLIRNLIQNKIDKINFLYKKYKISKKNLKIDIDKLNDDYDKLTF